MTYSKSHTEDDCDKCLDKVGKNNLFKLPYLYCDKNDNIHPDYGNGYRQYYVCSKCLKAEKVIENEKRKSDNRIS